MLVTYIQVRIRLRSICHIRTFDSLQVFIEEKTGLFVQILSLSLLLCKAKTVERMGVWESVVLISRLTLLHSVESVPR